MRWGANLLGELSQGEMVSNTFLLSFSYILMCLAGFTSSFPTGGRFLSYMLVAACVERVYLLTLRDAFVSWITYQCAE